MIHRATTLSTTLYLEHKHSSNAAETGACI